MASRKRERVGAVTEVDGDAATVALDMREEAARGAGRSAEPVMDMAEAIAIGLAVVPADMGAGAATGGVSVRASVGPKHHVVPAVHSDSGGPATHLPDGSVFFETQDDFARHMASETAGVLTADKLRRGADAMLRDSGFDPPLNPALANDPGGWCVHAPDWIGGRPVIARDAAGGALCGLTEAEARLVVRVLGSGYTAARES